jgi:hypothetical protein
MGFRLSPESSYFKTFWTPASAGVTLRGTFYEFIKFDGLVKSQKVGFSVIPLC